MSKSMGSSLLKLVQERALAKRALAEQEQLRKPYIPNECISNILLRLPMESLRRLQLVCKAWYNLINEDRFVDAHLSCSETVLIYLSSTPPSNRRNKQLNILSVEVKLLEMESVPIFKCPDLSQNAERYIKYLEIKDGKMKVGDFHVSCFGEIKSTCNGLVLISNYTMKPGCLLVMNPVTRSLLSVPPGTTSCGYGGYSESYTLAFSPIIKKHKVVHLFSDRLGFTGYETKTVGIAESWKSVEGPHIQFYTVLTSRPVFAIRALHWILSSSQLMSMEIDKEKFQTIPLPNNRPNYDYGKILEMRGDLCYVRCEGKNQVGIWVLKGLCGEKFVNLHSITTDYIISDLAPIFGSRIREEIIFQMRKDGSLYTYNLQKDDMTMLEIPEECPQFSLWHNSYVPHINSLVSWGAMDQFQEF